MGVRSMNVIRVSENNCWESWDKPAARARLRECESALELALDGGRIGMDSVEKGRSDSLKGTTCLYGLTSGLTLPSDSDFSGAFEWPGGTT